MFVCRGSDTGFNPISFVQGHSVSSGLWTSVVPMTTKHHGCAAAVVGEKVFLCGGCDNDINCLSSTEAYDALASKTTKARKTPNNFLESPEALVAVNKVALKILGQDGSSVFLSFVR